MKGADLELLCGVKITAPQSWELSRGRRLIIGSPDHPVSLAGSGEVSLKGADDALVTVFLKEGSSADLIKTGENGPKLVVQSTPAR